MTTSKVSTSAAVPVSKVSMNIQIKVPEPKAFDREKKDAKSWLKQVKRYFTAAGLNERSDEHNAQMNAIAQALMRGRANKWPDCLERLRTAPAIFMEFCTKILEQFSVLDDENTARDKLHTA